MKLPLWYKGKDGKYHHFPYEQLETLEDGTLGISHEKMIICLGETEFRKMHHLFKYKPGMDAYMLKEVPE